MYKQAATAENLRRIALENGIIPGVGRKWKVIAKRLNKQLSKNHPAKKHIDDILPVKKHWENIAKIDNYYIKNHNMLDREFSGGVDKEYATVTNIGSHTDVQVPNLKNGIKSFHKHPGTFAAPSKPDIDALKERMLFSPIGAVEKDYIFNSNSKGRGITEYSIKKISDDKFKGGINFVYRRDTSNFNLNGGYKIKDGDKYRVIPVNNLKTLDSVEYINHNNNDSLNVLRADGRKALYKRYNEPLEENDTNWRAYTENIFQKQIKNLKEKRKLKHQK